YGEAAPETVGGHLYWDPDLAVSAGPWVRAVETLAGPWQGTAYLAPGLAYVDERGPGSDVVPDLSARLGVLRDGARYRTSLEVF
ncbi:MAG: hypothetical protein GWM92_12490, partial [Gemmatimonadetes bacterium]|nr:hypothetical protein [Gemmatimonadota bacterium]NIT88196.1 hypothetical protein [Gemmatimonadota bacterium]NIU79711.1 hypothetical protein [Gammaproteobacteria bacterium]NIY12685.1 hypothetical protein [Gemmatimonadota bacterium]NIY40227.1 hypothetical protein [Gemmatimonadota bacterium]